MGARFKGQVVWITGGGSGIGRALALAFAEEGADVAVSGRRVERLQEAVGWSYAEPEPGFERLKRHFAFYSGITDTCYVGTEQVQPQPGDYYGGWVTSNIVGPFKGLPGTQRW